jgi:excisionase family DNA binding protein
MPVKTTVNQVTPPDITGRNFVSVPEAAAFLGVDIRTVRRAIRAGEIPATRVGAAWRVPTAWLRQQAAPGEPT